MPAFKTPSPALLLDRTTVSSLLTLDECIAAVERAFAAHARGQSLAPALMHIDGQGGEFHVKAGGLRDERAYFACKVNGGFFQNRATSGLPNIVGLILLSDAANGTPLAVMESGLVTQMRTGAATAVAAKYLARPDSRTVTICGAGLQGQIQLRALMRVLPLERAFLWSRSDASPVAQRWSDELGIPVQYTAALENATRQSQVIVTCTPARQPFLGARHVSAGTFVAAVGADSPEKHEIEPQLLASASVVCDLTAQCAEVGDLHHALSAGLMTREQVRGELGEVIIGAKPKRSDEQEIVVFDSTGTALQDVAAAAAVYEKALLVDAGEAFAFWS